MLEPLAVYIHWPYCARICPYCDFNVYKQRDNTDLIDAIDDDLFGWSQWAGNRRLSSIHFGGGTPSLMHAKEIDWLLRNIHQTCWGIPNECEIAIEANPADADQIKWQTYRDAGINRLSLGVQTFHDPALKFLGRDHDAAQARTALDMALEVFPSVSLDLIFGWQDQTRDMWQSDIDAALAAGPQHISAYQLTIEDGTAFGRAEGRGDKRAVGEDDSAEFYKMAREQLMAAGYHHYEVSNFAKSGHRSRHNLAYWQGRDYVGVGPGAHGRLTVDGQRYATAAQDRPQDYESCVKAKGVGFVEKEMLSRESWAEEYVLMGLRISDGISAKRYHDISGQEFSNDALALLLNEGLILKNDDRIKATDKGRLLLNWVTEKLLLG